MWLTRGWIGRGITPLQLSTFDASLLAILAAGTAYGAHVISRLRRQVVEARQLGQYHLKRKLGSGGMGEVYLAEHGALEAAVRRQAAPPRRGRTTLVRSSSSSERSASPPTCHTGTPSRSSTTGGPRMAPTIT